MANVQSNIIKLAATYLQKDILSYPNRLPEAATLPNLEILKALSSKCATSVTQFFNCILSHTNYRAITENVKRLFVSYSQDIIHTITKGKNRP